MEIYLHSNFIIVVKYNTKTTLSKTAKMNKNNEIILKI